MDDKLLAQVIGKTLVEAAVKGRRLAVMQEVARQRRAKVNDPEALCAVTAQYTPEAIMSRLRSTLSAA